MTGSKVFKKKHNKKIFVLVLITFLLNLIFPNIIFADDMLLDLETAKKLALENSKQIKAINLKVDKLELSAEIASDAYKDVLYSSYNTLLNEYLSLKKISEAGDHSVDGRIAALELQMSALKGADNNETIADLQDSSRDAKNAMKDMKMAREDFEKQLEYTIEKLYIEILKQKKNLLLLEKSYEINSKLLTIEKLKNKLGMSNAAAVNKIAVDVSNIYNSISGLKNVITVLKWQLNDHLGYEYNKNIKLKEFDISVDMFTPTFNNLLNQISSNYPVIKQIERDIKIKKEDQDDENYKDNDNKLEQLDLEIKENELTLQEKEFLLKTTTQNLISKLKTKAKDYTIAEMSYNNIYDMKRWDEKKYELGIISKIQLDSSILSLKEAENKKKAAAYDYFLAKRELELAQSGILLNN
jgi:hypothetical protein